MSADAPLARWACCRPQQELRVAAARQEAPRSSWGKATSFSPLDEEAPEPLEPLPEAASEASAPENSEAISKLDLEAMLQGSFMAMLEVHQKHAEKLQAAVLSRLGDIEATILRLPTGSGESEEPEREEEEQKQRNVEFQTGKLIHGCTACAITSTITSSDCSEDRAFLAEAWHKLRSRSRHLVVNSRFEPVVSGIIMLSVLVSFAELEWEGYVADVALGLQEPGGWQGAEAAFGALGLAFNILFLLEFLLRCLALGLGYLKDGWAYFDAFFVVTNIVDEVLLRVAAGGQQNLSVMRLLRCARMVRTFRAARGVKAVRPLLLLVQTILGSLGALFWSSILLFLVQLMGTIFVTKSLHNFIMDRGNAEEDRAWVNAIFGSGLKSIYTFFEITFSGGWPNHVRPLMKKAGAAYALFFVPYIAVWTFVIMRVIGALFIKNTLAMAEKVECARQSHELERKKMMRKIANYFKRADLDRNGSLCWEELEHLFEDPAVKSWCASNEIGLDDAQNLWTLLSSKGSLSVTEFVDGMLRMREPAKAIDLKAVLQCARSLEEQCQGIHEKVSGLEAKMTYASRKTTKTVMHLHHPEEG